MNKYAKKSTGQLVEILKGRCLCSSGKKKELVARLLENDKTFEDLEADTLKIADIPDPATLAGRFLLYDSSILRMRSSMARIICALRKARSPFSLIDICHEPYMCLFWRKEAKGRTLPALVKQGCVVGDLGQIRRWFESDDLRKTVDEACEQAGVGVEDPPGLYDERMWLYKPMIVPEEARDIVMLQPLVPFQRFSLPKLPNIEQNELDDNSAQNSESNDS